MKSFVGDNLELYVRKALKFLPMERLEKRNDVAEFRRFRDCSSGRVENELKTF